MNVKSSYHEAIILCSQHSVQLESCSALGGRLEMSNGAISSRFFLSGTGRDTLLGIVWRFEFGRVVQGRLALLMSSTSFSRSSREGFWPESVRKKTGSCATSFSSLRT